MIRQGLAYGIRNTLTKGCAKAFQAHLKDDPKIALEYLDRVAKADL